MNTVPAPRHHDIVMPALLRHARTTYGGAMRRAPYGKPQPGALKGYHPEFEYGELVKGRNYGGATRWLDHGTNHYHMQDSIPLSKIAEKLASEDYSAEVQRVSEEQAEKLILPWHERENTRHFCAAGGFFLNVKFNQKLWYTGKLDTQWSYPDTGDAGLAVGAALYTYYQAHPGQQAEKLQHMYYGPEFSAAEIEAVLKERKLEYEKPANVEVSDSSFETDTFLPNLFNFVGKLCDLGISRVLRHARMVMRALQIPQS